MTTVDAAIVAIASFSLGVCGMSAFARCVVRRMAADYEYMRESRNRWRAMTIEWLRATGNAQYADEIEALSK